LPPLADVVKRSRTSFQSVIDVRVGVHVRNVHVPVQVCAESVAMTVVPWMTAQVIVTAFPPPSTTASLTFAWR
jgi:hypothetical protein